MKQYFVAIDLGGTSAKCAIVSLDGKIVKEFTVPTLVNNETLNSDSILKNLEKYINKELLENNLTLKDNISTISLTVPGEYNHTKENVKLAPNINWKEYLVVAEAKKIWSEQDILCLNDAEAAVLGQCYISGEQDVILYILGTGVGGSVTRNGKLILEEKKDGTFSMGEFGHCSEQDPKQYSELQCNCGLVGCLETVASAKAINEQINNPQVKLDENEWEELNKFKKENKLDELNTFSLNEFVKDAKEDDLRFSIFKKLLDHPMAALANSMKTLFLGNPEFENHSFFIAGGGARIDKRFLDILKPYLEEDSLLKNFRVNISENPDKLALNGLIGFSLNKFNEKQVATQELATQEKGWVNESCLIL